jgi:protein FrlC
MSIQIAFNSSAYSYTPFGEARPYPFDEACRRIARAGYDHVEIAGVRPHAHPADNSPERFERLERALDETGLSAVHVCSHQVVLGLNPASPDAAEREAAVEYIRGLADLCTALEIPTFHLHPGRTIGEQRLDEAWDVAVETVDEALAGAALGGVRPQIEPLNPHDMDLVHAPEHAVRFVEALDHDVGVLLDTVQMAMGGIDMWDMVHEVGRDRLDVLHLADTDRRPPGAGEIDFESLFAALDDVGFDGVVSVELWGKQPDLLARQSLAAVERRLGR